MFNSKQSISSSAPIAAHCITYLFSPITSLSKFSGFSKFFNISAVLEKHVYRKSRVEILLLKSCSNDLKVQTANRMHLLALQLSNMLYFMIPGLLCLIILPKTHVHQSPDSRPSRTLSMFAIIPHYN